jgi:hypothetical protein
MIRTPSSGLVIISQCVVDVERSTRLTGLVLDACAVIVFITFLSLRKGGARKGGANLRKSAKK